MAVAAANAKKRRESCKSTKMSHIVDLLGSWFPSPAIVVQNMYWLYSNLFKHPTLTKDIDKQEYLQYFCIRQFIWQVFYSRGKTQKRSNQKYEERRRTIYSPLNWISLGECNQARHLANVGGNGIWVSMESATSWWEVLHKYNVRLQRPVYQQY